LQSTAHACCSVRLALGSAHTGSAAQRKRLVVTAMAQNKPYTLYTAGTPNGWKASITLEELGLQYDVKPISLAKNEQKEAWYLAINPNGRIPALVDHTQGDLSVFESGAIMLYLAEQADTKGTLLPKDVRDRAHVVSWLMWQMGGLGPMQGQANHFNRYAPEKVPYGINRYTNETERLFGVLEKHLSEGREYLVGNKFSLADIACFSWVLIHDWSGVSLDDKPNLQKWVERIQGRPAVQRGLDVPEPSKIVEATKNPELAKKMIEDAQKMQISSEAKK